MNTYIEGEIMLWNETIAVISRLQELQNCDQVMAVNFLEAARLLAVAASARWPQMERRFDVIIRSQWNEILQYPVTFGVN